MARRALCIAAFLTLVLATASAVPCFAISKEFDQTYPPQQGGSFELQNVNGTVEVQTWDRDEVEVHAVKTAKHQESDLELVSIALSIPSRFWPPGLPRLAPVRQGRILCAVTTAVLIRSATASSLADAAGFTK